MFGAVLTAVITFLPLPEFAVATLGFRVCVCVRAVCSRVMYCDPQGVAHVMIQSFQLSSCTLCNAPIQDVSETSVCVLMPLQI